MKLPSPGAKAPAKLSESIEQRLNLYTLAASAASLSVLALTPPAQAKIVYTPAHIKITPNHKLMIDFNHDGIKDFELNDTGSGSSDSLAINPLQTGNAVAEANGDCNPSPGAAALQAGVRIGKGQVFGNYYCMAQYIAADGGSLGPWAGGVKNRFLGLQFMIKGQKHFGWVRLSVSTPPFVVHLNGYAYETVPNKPIVAGKTAGKTKGPGRLSTVTGVSDRPPAGLGALALGSSGLSMWR